MAIYDFSKVEKNALNVSPIPHCINKQEAPAESELNDMLQIKTSRRSQFFSSFAARLFFLLLLLGDLLWSCYAVILFSFSLLGLICTAGKIHCFKALIEGAWISLRRSMICGVALFIALFSPSFGIMIACTYFLMYDKSGIEEVVPSSLQSQFKEFFPKE